MYKPLLLLYFKTKILRKVIRMLVITVLVLFLWLRFKVMKRLPPFCFAFAPSEITCCAIWLLLSTEWTNIPPISENIINLCVYNNNTFHLVSSSQNYNQMIEEAQFQTEMVSLIPSCLARHNMFDIGKSVWLFLYLRLVIRKLKWQLKI